MKNIMNKINRLPLWTISGVLWFITAIISRNMAYLPIGLACIFVGIKNKGKSNRK